MSEIMYIPSITEDGDYRVLGLFSTLPKALDEMAVVWGMETMKIIIPLKTIQIIERTIDKQSYYRFDNHIDRESGEILAVTLK